MASVYRSSEGHFQKAPEPRKVNQLYEDMKKFQEVRQALTVKLRSIFLLFSVTVAAMYNFPMRWVF